MKKPLNFKNYGSIPHLSTSKLGSGDHFIEQGQERILTEKVRDKNDTVIVTEKYDGSNVGVAKKDGKIIALTRSGYLANTSPYKQHHWFAKWVDMHKHYFNYFLQNGERIVGELLVKTHSIQYVIDSITPIVFFDWFDSNNKRKPFYFLEGTNLPLPRVLHKGTSIDTGTVSILLRRNRDKRFISLYPEGAVYRVEREFKCDFLAKWVNHDFVAGVHLDDNSMWNYDI